MKAVPSLTEAAKATVKSVANVLQPDAGKKDDGKTDASKKDDGEPAGDQINPEKIMDNVRTALPDVPKKVPDAITDNLPDLNNLSVPNVPKEIPSPNSLLKNMPDSDITTLKVPTVEVPNVKIPTVKVPDLNLPTPSMPNVDIPNIDLPKVDSLFPTQQSNDSPSAETPKDSSKNPSPDSISNSPNAKSKLLSMKKIETEDSSQSSTHRKGFRKRKVGVSEEEKEKEKELGNKKHREPCPGTFPMCHHET